VRRALVFAVLVSALVLPLGASARTSNSATTTTVKVTGKEFAFILSRKSGPRGIFVFRFTNRGTVPHDFKIAGKKTPLVQAGQSATLRVKILKPRKYVYICTVPGHAAAGMKGVFRVK